VGLNDEIFEQPEALDRLLNSELTNIRFIAETIRNRDIRLVYIIARGSSDNAGLYAKYLFGIANKLPVAMALPSLFTLYGSPPNLSNTLTIAISQSGESPDIVSALEEGRRQGATTVAITNTPASPLGQAAEFCVNLHAGEEHAIAATKTYTTELLAIAMLSATLAEDGARLEALNGIPDLAKQALLSNDAIAAATQRFRYMSQCVVLGRGYNYATAYEWSLKLKELAYIVAEPYSSADFQHGPIAIVERGFPVMAVITEGAVAKEVTALCRRLVEEKEAELVVLSNVESALALGRTPIALPAMGEWLSPIISMIPAQLFCLHLTLTKGYDAEHPRGLTKVTETR
jgi:glucosamine--fructose-6-phosphate aminotransferase (isomerizing)